MPVWVPNMGLMGEDTSNPRIVLWHGFCSVHKRFTISQIENFRERFPEGKVIVHPECEAEVVNAADSNGSTQFIKNYVESMPEGSKVGIGTEINMVARLAQEHPDKHIECLDSQVCPCSTMYMIHPAYLMDVLERLVDGEIPNQIIVPDSVQEGSMLALNRMLSIPK